MYYVLMYIKCTMHYKYIIMQILYNYADQSVSAHKQGRTTIRPKV